LVMLSNNQDEYAICFIWEAVLFSFLFKQ
jgi:hypothetical protein